MAHNAEFAANDPALFGALVQSMQEYHTTHSEPFFLQFPSNPTSQTKYKIDNYPHYPQEIVGGDVDAREVERYHLREQPNSMIVESGTMASGEALDTEGVEHGVTTWLFNAEQQAKYSRIGEIAAHEIEADGTHLDNEIYWVETDGTVWTRHYMDHDEDRRQMADFELAELNEIVRHMAQHLL